MNLKNLQVGDSVIVTAVNGKLIKIFLNLLKDIASKKIKTLKDFQHSLDEYEMTYDQFVQTLKQLWDLKKIDYKVIDLLDQNTEIFKGPGLFSDEWWIRNFGKKQFFDRIPPKYQQQFANTSKKVKQ